MCTTKTDAARSGHFWCPNYIPVSATSVVRSRCPSMHVMTLPVGAHDSGLWRVRPKSVAVREPASTPHKDRGHVCPCHAYFRHPLLFRFTRMQSSYLAIRVMQTTQNWEGNDVAPGINRASYCIPRFRNVLVNALVWSHSIEIPHVLVEDLPEMRFAEDQHMVKAFTPDAP